MSNELLAKTALQRQEAFKNLPKHLKTIKKTVGKLDPKAEVYLFGSVADNSYNYSSDIDILVVTDTYPAKVICELWKAGIENPFEIHVYPPEKADFFKNAKLVRL
jgi:hypothetical protein